MAAAFNAILPHQSITTFTATLPPLRLGIAQTNNSVTFSWPVGASGFALQVAGQLPATNWSSVTNAAVVMGNQKVVTLEMSSGNQFFRLTK